MRRPRGLIGLALLAASSAVLSSAAAATLRDAQITLTDASVRLSDLFDGVSHDRVIGPAPEPGGRIVVESAQLAAIARQFNVDWRPADTGARVVMERPGQHFPREPALAALRIALLAAGMPANSEIETPAFNPPMVPPGDSARPDVTEALYDAGSGRFTALLSITADGMTPFNTRLSGHAQEMMDVEVTARRMAAGEVLSSGDLQPARVRAGLVRSEPARLPEQAAGMALRRPLSAGVPVLLADLGRPVVMQRGSPVQLELNLPGLAVTVRGVAMEPAAIGDRVHVLNPSSRAVMEGEVMGATDVRVTAGASPVVLSPGAPIPQQSQTRVAVR